MTGTVVVCGDSIATPFGLLPGRDAQAFPQLLRKALSHHDLKVTSMAKAGLMITDTLTLLNRVADLNPAVVILVHGGKESLLRESRLLRFIRTDPEIMTVRGWKVPLQLVRQHVYRYFLRLNEGFFGAAAAAIVAGGPHLHHKRFRSNFELVTQTILESTSAHIISLVPCGRRMNIYPWSVKHNGEIQRIIVSSASCNERISCLDLRQPKFLSVENYIRDGVHYSRTGHQAVADDLAGMLISLKKARADT